MKIWVSNSQTRKKYGMPVVPSHTVRQVLKAAAKAFKTDDSKFIILKGTEELDQAKTLEDAGINDGDILDIIAEPKGG